MNDEENPIRKIEDEKMLLDMGKMGFLIYRGATEEGATLTEAFRVTSAYFKGMFGSAQDTDYTNNNYKTVLEQICDPSYVGSKEDAEVVEIYRTWARNVLVENDS